LEYPPTDQASLAEMTATALSTLLIDPGLGLATMLQLEPFQRSGNWRTIMALSLVSPDHAQHQASAVTTCSTTPIQFGISYVAPALIMPTDHQCYATCKGLTYVRPLQRMEEDKVLVRVAPLDHRLDAPGKFFTLVLTESQLALALPYDRPLRDMPYQDCREEVEAHAMRMLRRFDRQLQMACRSTSAETESQEKLAQPDAPLQKVAHLSKMETTMYCKGSVIVLSTDIIQQAYATMQGQSQHRRLSTKHLPVLLLRAALLLLIQLIKNEQDPFRRGQLARQEAELRRVLVCRHRLHPRVDVTPLYEGGDKHGQIAGCTLRVGIPLALVA
jgi:hypothetical protein